MTTDAIDRGIRDLARAVEDNAEALLALELDPTRKLLEASTLAGASAEAWSTASAALARAWEAQALLEDHLARLRDLRGSRSRVSQDRLLELEDLLHGGVLAVGTAGERRSAQELLAECSAAVAQARQVVSTAAQAWEALVPRLTTASATLRACAELLDELGVAHDDALLTARRDLARLTDAVAKDPLVASPETIARLDAAVAAVRADAERLRDFRADADARIDDARALLAEARRAQADAREAHDAALAKIAAAEVPRVAALPSGLADDLDRAIELARAGSWREADAALERLRRGAAEARDAALRVAAANRAPLAQRDELRRRLGAYQAKAQRLRMLEDPMVDALHARAHRVLHTAPTDLAEAAELVRRYQERVSKGPESEALR
jgi:chromosome segregation ATPase